MMMILDNEKFVLLPVEFEGKQVWCIFENATEQVINHFTIESCAREYLEFLKDGGCFDGFTPSFFLTEVKSQRNQ